MIPISLHWTTLVYQSIQILGLLDWTIFITPDIYKLGCSSSRIISLSYFLSWVAKADQYSIYFFIFFWATIQVQFLFLTSLTLGLYTGPCFSGDFWKTCPARCSLALCYGYFRPLPPPLWGSFAARFFFFIFLIFLFFFLLLSYTGKST